MRTIIHSHTRPVGAKHLILDDSSRSSHIHFKGSTVAHVNFLGFIPPHDRGTLATSTEGGVDLRLVDRFSHGVLFHSPNCYQQNMNHDFYPDPRPKENQ